MTADPLPAVQNEFLKVETSGSEPVPIADRRARPWEVGGVWAGAFTNYVSLLTGSLLLTFGLGLTDAITAITIGALAAAIILGAVSVSGPRGGVPQIVFSRVVFGRQGAYLAGALTLFLAIGWFAVDCVVAANAFTQLLREFGTVTSRGVTAILLLLVVVISGLVAIYGHRTVVVFERYGAGVFLLFAALLLAMLAPKVHWHLASTVHGSARVGSWLLGASVTFALVASWFSFAADYSRYLPPDTPTRAVIGWITAGTALPTIALEVLGVLLFSINTHSGDLLTTIVGAAPRPLAVMFLLFVVLGMIWANYLDVYTAGLVALALDLPLRRWQTAGLAAGIGGLLAAYALFVSTFDQAYTNFLLITYIWAPAWAAVTILHLFVLVPRPVPVAEFTRRSGIHAPAVLAVLAGTIAALPFVNSTLWQSPLAVHLLQGADLSGFVSFVVGGAVYLALRPARETSR